MQKPTEASKTELLKKSINIASNILRQELLSSQSKNMVTFHQELDNLSREFRFDYRTWAKGLSLNQVKFRLLQLIELAKYYLERKLTESSKLSATFVDFNIGGLPADIWCLIFSLMTRIDLAMLQQASKYFKRQVDAFKKTRNYKLLLMDHSDYGLPPLQKVLPIAKNISFKELQAISPNHFLFLLDDIPYIYDSIFDKCYPLFTQEQRNAKIVVSASNNHDELYFGLEYSTIEIFRLDEQGTYVKLQTLNLPTNPNLPIFITVVSKDKFIVYNPAVVYLCQKMQDGKYNLTQILEDCSTDRSIEMINDTDLFMRTFTEDQDRKVEASILCQNIEGKYTKLQSLGKVTEIYKFIRINSAEFLLHERYLSSVISLITIWKKNTSDLYEISFRKTLSDADVTVLKNGDLLFNSNILETYEKRSDGYNVDRVTRIVPRDSMTVKNAFVSENDNGDLLFLNYLNLWVKRTKSDSIDFLARLSTPVKNKAISSSGNILIYHEESTTFLFFRNSTRVLNKFAAPKMLAKSILKRLENAILFSQYGATDKGKLTFLNKRVIAVKDKDVMVHPIMKEILNCMTEAKKSIEDLAVKSAKDEDKVYTQAIVNIKTIIMNYKGESIKSRLYLFHKLIEEFEQNRAAHETDIEDETVAFAS